MPLLEIAQGIRLAERALELGKDDGNVLWMASFAVRDLANDGQRAKELAHRSLRLNPNSAVALANAGWMLAAAQKWTKTTGLKLAIGRRL